MSHGCKAVVIFCMDYRLNLLERARLLEEAGYPASSYDLLSFAGAGKDYATADPVGKQFIAKQIKIAKDLHGVQEVVVICHDNCGAYGIVDPDEEHATQSSHLTQLGGDIKKDFDLDIKSFIIKGTPTGQLKLVEVAVS